MKWGNYACSKDASHVACISYSHAMSQIIALSFNLLSFSPLGKLSFNRRCLHDIGNTPNPYEQAISIIGRTLSAFDEDNLIPCFGFGDGKFVVPIFHFDHLVCAQ